MSTKRRKDWILAGHAGLIGPSSAEASGWLPVMHLRTFLLAAMSGCSDEVWGCVLCVQEKALCNWYNGIPSAPAFITPFCAEVLPRIAASVEQAVSLNAFSDCHLLRVPCFCVLSSESCTGECCFFFMGSQKKKRKKNAPREVYRGHTKYLHLASAR